MPIVLSMATKRAMQVAPVHPITARMNTTFAATAFPAPP